MVLGAWAQEKKPATPRKIFVRETLGLLKVGFGEKAVFDYWDKKGWPTSINDIDFVQIRDAKATPKLLSRLRKLLEGHAVFSELADHFEPFEVKLADGKMLKMLKPRGWHVTHSKAKDRYNELKKDKSFQNELKAARALGAIEQLAGEIKPRYRGRPEPKSNVAVRAKMKVMINSLIKRYPGTVAANSARALATAQGVKLN